MTATGSRFAVGSVHGELNTPLLEVLDPLEGEAGYRGLFKCQAVSKDEDQLLCLNVFEARIALVRNNNTSSCGCLRYRPVASAMEATQEQAREAAEIVAAAPPAEEYLAKKIAAKGEGVGRNSKAANAAIAAAKTVDDRPKAADGPESSDTASEPKFLYGIGNDCDEVWDEPAGAYESWMDDRHDPVDRDTSMEIVRWETTDGRHLLRSASIVAQYVAERFGVGCDDEGAADRMAQAARDPEVVAAFDVTLDLMSKTMERIGPGWHWTARRDGVEIVTFDADLRPLLNGKPMFAPVTPTPEPEKETNVMDLAIEEVATLFPYLSINDRIEWWCALGCDLNLLTVHIVSFQDRVNTAIAARDAEQHHDCKP